MFIAHSHSNEESTSQQAADKIITKQNNSNTNHGYCCCISHYTPFHMHKHSRERTHIKPITIVGGVVWLELRDAVKCVSLLLYSVFVVHLNTNKPIGMASMHGKRVDVLADHQAFADLVRGDRLRASVCKW